MAESTRISGRRARGLRRFIYPAPAWRPELFAGELVELPGDDSTAPAYLFHRPAPSGAPTVVYLHGNGCDLSGVVPQADLVTARGLGYAAIEYPGYGAAASQRASEDALHESAVRALTWLIEVAGVAADDVVLVGESLGSAVAARLSVEGYGARLVLVSAFTSMPAMFRRMVPGFPRRLVPDRFDTLSRAPQIRVPTLLVHGDADKMVPPSMSAELAAVIPGARRELIAGRGHPEIWQPPEPVLSLIVDFARGR